jgi:hypothetical protein
VAEWLALAGDIAATYVSTRRSDDPALYQRVVIVTKPTEGPSHLIHAPSSRAVWIVFTLGRRTGTQHFPTIRDALNSIRPVLGDDGIKVPAEKPEM